MPKKSVVHRNKRREKLANRLRDLRATLRKSSKDINLDPDERYEASLKLQKMPRDAGQTRSRNRCKVCGRPRAYNRLTGLCRLHMRIAVLKGMIPGMRKASW